MLTGRNRVVLDLTGKQQHGGQGSRYMGVVHISTSCVKNGLAAAGEALHHTAFLEPVRSMAVRMPDRKIRLPCIEAAI